jgi:hypothetical protein
LQHLAIYFLLKDSEMMRTAAKKKELTEKFMVILPEYLIRLNEV